MAKIGRSTASFACVIVVFLLLLLATAEAAEGAGGGGGGGSGGAVADEKRRLCQSQSHRFRGKCLSDRNCGSICNSEGFTGGKCVGFRRRCFCTRPC